MTRVKSKALWTLIPWKRQGDCRKRPQCEAECILGQYSVYLKPLVKFLVKYTLPVPFLSKALDSLHFAALSWDDFPARQART